MKKWILIVACAAVACLGLTSCATGPKRYSGTGSLVVDVTCEDGRLTRADLFFDGERIGDISTESGKLFYYKGPNGPHLLRVESPGYTTVEKEVKLKGKHPGTWVRVKLELAPKPEPEQKAEDK